MNILNYTTIRLIKIYKFLISPLIGDTCRFLPTCSDYSIEVLKEFNFFKAIFLIIKRIFSCHPWSHGGFDPVNKKMKVKK